MKMSKGEKIFQVINYIILTVIGLLALYPFIYVLSASFSSPDAVITGKVVLLPKEINLYAYKAVFKESGIWIAYANTIFYTVVGVSVSMILTVCGSYALSKKRLMGRTFFSMFIAFTMWFSAGMIPSYLNMRDLNLLNSRFGIIIGFCISTFNVILLRTYFQGVPDEMEEAATVDGANDLIILTKIYLPLSKPALATIALFYGIGRWNSYFWSMILLTDEKKVPLQVLLKKLIVQMNISDEKLSASYNATTLSKETFIYATIIVAIIPIIIIYPYIQGYFVKGVMIGSIKG